MIDVQQSFQACYFSNFSDVQASAQNISKLLPEFAGLDVVPSTFQEIAFPSGPAVRLMFTTPSSGEWQIQFESGRLNIQKVATDIAGENMGPGKKLKAEKLKITIISEDDFKSMITRSL